MEAEKLTTKQAQDRAGVSRHALMRAPTPAEALALLEKAQQQL